jgi:hypothetical protein
MGYRPFAEEWSVKRLFMFPVGIIQTMLADLLEIWLNFHDIILFIISMVIIELSHKVDRQTVVTASNCCIKINYDRIASCV